MTKELNELPKDVFTDNFGKWEVKDDGRLIYHGEGIAERDFPPSCLMGQNLTHMLSKHWGEHSKDAVDYYFAYLRALRNAGYKSLTIDLTNIHKSEVK